MNKKTPIIAFMSGLSSELFFLFDMLIVSSNFFFQLVPNVFVYEKMRFCMRGFSAGKSEETKAQLT